MDKNLNPYSRRYEIPSSKGVYDKIAENSPFKKIYGEKGDSLLIRGDLRNLLLIEKKNNNKEILKIHSKEPQNIHSQLENLTGVDLSEYRLH